MSKKNLQLILEAIDKVNKPFTSGHIEELIGKTRNASSMLNYLLKRNILRLAGKNGRVIVYDLVDPEMTAVEAHRTWRVSPARIAHQAEPEANYPEIPFLLASVKLTADNPRIRL